MHPLVRPSHRNSQALARQVVRWRPNCKQPLHLGASMQAAHRCHSSPHAVRLCSGGGEAECKARSYFGTRATHRAFGRSEVQWSQLSEPLDCRERLNLFKLVRAWLGGKGRVEMDNLKLFKARQLHPSWGCFVTTFGDSLGVQTRWDKLEVGEKFAEGGRAELFHAHVTWAHPRIDEVGEKHGVERSGLSRCSRWALCCNTCKPNGPTDGCRLQVHVEGRERAHLGKSQPFRNHSSILCATLLRDGRFVFLMVKDGQGRGGSMECH